MGKKKKGSSTKASKATRGPSAPPASKSKGGKKRTSAKGGSVGTAISDMMSGMDFSNVNLPGLPSLQTNSPKPRVSMGRNGQIQFGAPRRRSRKGLSGSDIKGFLRVHKFAGLLTKVEGRKHRALPKKRR